MQQGINELVYGTMLDISIKKKKSQFLVFICPNESRLIRLVNFQSNQFSFIDLTEIADITKTNTMKLKVRNRKLDTMKIFFNENNSREIINIGLQYWVDQAKEIERRLDTENSVWSHALKLIHKADDNIDMSINLAEFVYLIGELQIGLSERKTIQVFKEYARNDQLSEKELYLLVQNIYRKQELYPLFEKYCTKREGMFDDQYSSKLMSKDDIQTFFLIEQGVKYVATEKGYNFYEFQNMLVNPENCIFKKVELDTSQPLSQYLINSSHNTYLAANQLTGQSSIQSYIDAFNLGIKCVELDCWDGQNGYPIVTHGHTLTSKIYFEDVIKVVKEYGFSVDQNPVILSIEMHCGLQQQELIVEIMQKTLGDSLFKIDNYHLENYPTVRELFGKVIIKNKADQQYLDSKMNRGYQQQQIMNQCLPQEHIQQLSKQVTKPPQVYQMSNTLPDDQYIVFDETEEQQEIRFNQTVSQDQTKSCVSLQRITGLFGVHLDIDNNCIWNCSSITEDKLTALIKKKHGQLREYLKKSFIRVYPTGIRIDSSNYNPCPAWEVGAQIVALNQQTKDLFMLINYGRFLNSSYVLKSYQNQTIKLSITIISAQNFVWEDHKQNQEEVVDPFIKVRLAGHSEDEKASQHWRTETVKDNGYHPIFNYKCDILVHHPNQAIIYFIAYSYSLLSSTQIGQYALPLMNMHKGYRVIPMLNSQMQPIHNCYILAHIKLEQL